MSLSISVMFQCPWYIELNLELCLPLFQCPWYIELHLGLCLPLFIQSSHVSDQETESMHVGQKTHKQLHCKCNLPDATCHPTTN